MTREELLKPRYKVIADFPLAYVAIGEILNGEVGSVVEGGYWRTEYAKYPHLFKELEWWEEREEKELPEYFKVEKTGQIFKGSLPKEIWGGRSGVFIDKDNLEWHWKSECLPATLEEYQTSLKSNKK